MNKSFVKEPMVVNGKVYFPRKKSAEALATYTSPEEINPEALPVGRVSVDTVGFGELLRDLISEMRSVGAAYPLEYLEAMQNLSLVNPDVAQMIDNIVQLGNTGHKVMVEADREQVQQAAMEELNRFNMTVFGRFGGIDGFVNSVLAQIGRGGAISVEWVVNEDLTGIDKIVFVPLKEIRFLYDPASGEYAPHQKTCDLTQGDQGLIALNTATYQYCAMQTLDNSPYAVPPILSALESITIQRDIVKNLRFIAKQMGLLGFVNFLIRAPKQSPGEKTEEYIARCQRVLETMGLFFAQSLENSVLDKKTSKNIKLIYSYFRLEDAEPFGGDLPIKPSFNLVDKKAINFLKNSDDFYFGRYLTNPQTKRELKNWLVDEYLKSGRNLRDSGELAKFRNRFGDRVAQEDYKILRVVETSTNRSRNWGNIFLVEQAKAASIEITGPLDNVTCPWCQSMTGKKFRVDPVVQHVRDVLDQDP